MFENIKNPYYIFIKRWIFYSPNFTKKKLQNFKPPKLISPSIIFFSLISFGKCENLVFFFLYFRTIVKFFFVLVIWAKCEPIKNWRYFLENFQLNIKIKKTLEVLFLVAKNDFTIFRDFENIRYLAVMTQSCEIF